MCANRFWNPFEFRRGEDQDLESWKPVPVLRFLISVPPVLVHELTHAFDFARAKARSCVASLLRDSEDAESSLLPSR